MSAKKITPVQPAAWRMFRLWLYFSAPENSADGAHRLYTNDQGPKQDDSYLKYPNTHLRTTDKL